MNETKGMNVSFSSTALILENVERGCGVREEEALARRVLKCTECALVAEAEL